MNTVRAAIRIFLATAALGIVAFAQQTTPAPIIDMHLHVFSAVPSALACAPIDYLPPRDAKEDPDYNSVPITCALPLKAPATDDELMNRTIEVLRKLNITAVANGSPEKIDIWKKAGGDRILPATNFDGTERSLADLRSWVKSGRVVVFAEIGTQYGGIPANSPKLEPYFALAKS